jgi:transposase
MPLQSELFTEATSLRDRIHGLEIALKASEARQARLSEELEWTKEAYLSLRRARFGPRKERWSSEEQGLLVFNEAEREASKESERQELQQDQKTIEVKGFTRARGKRKPLAAHLPRRIEVIELPESERKAADGTPLKVIGKEVSEKLYYEPAKLEVIEYHRLRYGLDSGEPVKTAAPVPSVIPKGIATASLLAGIITNKYADGLPLYRQEQMFERAGVELSRGSMGRWIVRSATAATAVWNVLEERLLASDYVSCDETHTQVLKEKGRSAESKSWMWVRTTPNEEKKIVLFDYDPHRSAEVAKRLLRECRGYIQVDGYDSYNIIEKEPWITRIGCNMHGRRKFEDAFKCGAKTGRGLSSQGLQFYQQLYDIERQIREKGMTWAERFEYRRKLAVPVWHEMKRWAEQNAANVPPSSKLGNAFGYFIREYEYLKGYLYDGKLEMDNGFAERAIRKFGIGRNNWMFSDTEGGAAASAILYSFVITAKINGVNPLAALTRMFELLPTARTIDDYEMLADLLLSPTTKH